MTAPILPIVGIAFIVLIVVIIAIASRDKHREAEKDFSPSSPSPVLTVSTDTSIQHSNSSFSQKVQDYTAKQANTEYLAEMELAKVDIMDGVDFEAYVANLLRGRGYITTVTKASGDQGVDIVAQKAGVRFAIQVKRQSQKVSRRAVADAVAGKVLYDCSKAMVITNNYFQGGAEQLAYANDCELVDRDELISWIQQQIIGHMGNKDIGKGTTTSSLQIGFATKPLTASVIAHIQTIQVSSDDRSYIDNILRTHLERGHQGFIVYPIAWNHLFIHRTHETLSKRFSKYSIALIDEYTSYEDLFRIEAEFKNGDVSVIMCNDVSRRVEVSPKIRVVIIENAEEYESQELINFRNILSDKKGEKHFLMISDSTTELLTLPNAEGIHSL